MQILEFFQKYNKFIIYLTLILALVSFFDKVLVVGFLLILFLCSLTFLVIRKKGDAAKILGLLFLIVFLIHIIFVFFLHYANFDPFGGASDYLLYNETAKEIYKRVHVGNFSLEGLFIPHYYPVFVGYLYLFTLPEMFIGQILNAWIAAVSAIFIYLIVVKIGGSKKGAFFTGIIAGLYPSFLFFGSLLLKDGLVVLLSLISLFFILKIIKNFSLGRFLIIYLAFGALIHFRIYVGYAAIFTFIISWTILSGFDFKKRMKYLAVMIFFIGFLPQFFAGQSYFGINFLSGYLSKGTITYYREQVYMPQIEQPQKIEVKTSKIKALETEVIESNLPGSRSSESKISESKSSEPVLGRSSSVLIKTGFENPFTFLRNTVFSFLNASLGPFFWQIKEKKHIFALPEVFAWYFLLFFIIKGAIDLIKKKHFIILPLIIFSIFVFGVLAVYVTNFGIITRIRMPAILSLLCLFSLGFKKINNIKIPFLEKYL